jgi:hypothetical protein
MTHNTYSCGVNSNQNSLIQTLLSGTEVLETVEKKVMGVTVGIEGKGYIEGSFNQYGYVTKDPRQVTWNR